MLNPISIKAKMEKEESQRYHFGCVYL